MALDGKADHGEPLCALMIAALRVQFRVVAVALAVLRHRPVRLILPSRGNLVGVPGRIRTIDRRLRRPLLFQLSYGDRHVDHSRLVADAKSRAGPPVLIRRGARLLLRQPPGGLA